MTQPPQTVALADRIVEATTGALELFGIHLGVQLGLYDALRTGGALTPDELATATGIAPRYAREWLEQQAVAGMLQVDDAGASPTERRYHLPETHVGALAEATDVEHVAPLARMVVAIATVLPEVEAAYRTGGGVPYSHYGADFRAGQGAINRPAYSTALVEDWLPAAGDLADRLRRGGRLADLGCGLGWSTIAVARAFPDATVIGIDADDASVADARALAAAEGVTARFEAADAAGLAALGPFDGILVLEALHDMADPAAVLAAAATALADGGCIVVADEAVADEFVAPGDVIERMMYGWSITHCLPASMVERPSAAIGTVIRADTVRELAADAGLACEVLDVDGGFFRIYRLSR